MKTYFYILFLSIIFFGCQKTPSPRLNTQRPLDLKQTSFEALPNIQNEDFNKILDLFIKNCQAKKTKKIYGSLCQKATTTNNPKEFFMNNFVPYKIINKNTDDTGLLTGYYEATLHGSLKPTKKYKYPIYGKPDDLITIKLDQIYPELKNYRLRGRLIKNKIVPYYSREEFEQNNTPKSVLCYCDSKIDKFFLEVQGSGKIILDNNQTLLLGYADQNGHKYRSIGRYMINHNMIKKEDISLDSIKKYLNEHPEKRDEILNYNNSMVFFKKRSQNISGALGVELTPMRSIAVDKRYISLGIMLYLNTNFQTKNISHIVFAQDTGGAIKGQIRADLFTGSSDQAMRLAGSLKAPLNLWIFLPKPKD